jgi:hypothetical protein
MFLLRRAAPTLRRILLFPMKAACETITPACAVLTMSHLTDEPPALDESCISLYFTKTRSKE